ncbi:Spy/CpxP family protein refolding chaperone [bacterium]|nr:Spy/CpxP family protein refolding chaperone [bacterium]
MIKNFLTITVLLFITATPIFAHDCENIKTPQKPTLKEQKQWESMLDERLKLTDEQRQKLRENKQKHKKEMGKIVDKMQIQHDKIRDIYYSGIPKFQADIKTAPMKAELVILKQNADKLRQENRKNFKTILTEEQNAEFEKIKEEMQTKKR